MIYLFLKFIKSVEGEPISLFASRRHENLSVSLHPTLQCISLRSILILNFNTLSVFHVVAVHGVSSQKFCVHYVYPPSTFAILTFIPSVPNDVYIRHTAQLTSRHSILNIYSTNTYLLTYSMEQSPS